MIESLSIRNFKVLREVDLKLRPLTVIVGPNASGKSSILQAIALTLDLSGDRDLSLIRSHAAGTGPIIAVRVDGVDYKIDFSNLDLRYGLSPPFPKWASLLLDLDPHLLAEPSYPTDVSLSLPSDGRGLSSILAGLQLERPDLFNKIIDRLRSVVPNLEGLRLRRALVAPERVGHEILFDMLGAEGIPAKSASHGTLLTLGILTALSLNDGPQVALIDDLERGLHPKAMSDFVQQLRGIQNPNLQIVATSHSPYLIDCVEADEVLLTSIDEEGYALVRPLTDHPDYAEWKGLMQAGEFWSSVGEDWITREKKATA